MSRINVQRIVDQYLQIIMDSIPDHKILIMDQHTTGIVAQVKGQTELLDMGVYLFNQLGRRPETTSDVAHLDAVVLVRPTRDNIDKLVVELQSPKHKSYHIFFTNILPEGFISRLAEADQLELVVQVKEVFLDFVPVNSDLWNLRLPNSFCMMNESGGSQRVYEHHVQALVSLLLATKLRPQIRYDKNSPISKRLAFEVQRNIEDHNNLFAWEQHGNQPLLLILDRREDPVTPLLTQWTYQAMVHEILNINNSRVDLRDRNTQGLGEIILNSFDDEFFAKHLISNFGDLGIAVKGLITQYAQKRGDNSNITSIEDMQKFVDGYSEYMQSSNAVSKHVGVLTELSNIVAKRNLLEISACEQDIACSDNMSKHFQEICNFIDNPRHEDFDCLKLVILYALRYENASSNNLPRLRERLRNRSGGEAVERVRFVDLVLNICGQRYRTGDLFGNQSLGGKFSNMMRGFKGVENVYTQHNPYLEKIINDVLKKDLSQQQYPIVDGRLNKRTAPTDILIFIVGGTTYEEAAMVRRKAQSSRVNLLLGGSCVHNARSFLADLNESSNYHIPVYEEEVQGRTNAYGEPDLI